MKEYHPSHFDNEAEPTLPEDTTQAVQELLTMWENRDNWKSPDLAPVMSLDELAQLKKTDPTLWEIEKDKVLLQLEAGKEFEWLAEFFNSQMVWTQHKIETNHAQVICFQFGYHNTDDVPNCFVYKPLGSDEAEMFYKNSEGWVREKMSDVYQEFARTYRD